MDVIATGWLDAVTAARIRRPDVVLVSMDLPENAPHWMGKRASGVVIGLLLISGFALLVRLFLEAAWGRAHTRPTLEVEWLAFSAVVVPLAAAVVVGLAARTRPLSIAERRSSLGWLGLFLLNGGRVVPGGGMLALFAGWTLGSLALAAWAWLGPSPTPWFKRSRRSFQVLAGALVLLAVAPWAAVLWCRGR